MPKSASRSRLTWLFRYSALCIAINVSASVMSTRWTAESVAKAVCELNSSFEDFEDEDIQDETSNQRAVD